MASRGRPSEYTPEKAEEICAWMSDGGSLRQYCMQEGAPAFSTVCRWRRQNEDFRANYDQAREDWADAVFEELFEISDDGTNDTYTVHDNEGNEMERVNHDHISRSKLRVDTRKWALARMNARRFGDRQAIDVGGQKENPLNLADLISKAQAD